MTSVRLGLLYSFIEKWLSMLLALGSSMVLARLLTPEEIGIYSVTLAVIGIAHVLRDFGIGNYLIQEKNLTEAHVRTAFSLSLLIGLSLCGLLLALAERVASFYNDQRMVPVMNVVALNFAALPFCSISLAMLRRDLRFKVLMYLQTSAAVLNTAVTLTLAWQDNGPVSMAWGSLAGNVFIGAATWLARGKRKVLVPGWSEWRTVGAFGAQNVSAGLVTTLAMDINDLVVGKLLGFAPVAVLSRAQGLMNLVHRDAMGAVRNVAYPAFAKVHREGGNVEAMHAHSVTLMTAFGWPFYGFLALFADEITELLYGPQWSAAAALVPVFCAAGAAVLCASLIPNAITAVGRNDLVVRFEMMFQLGRATIVAGAAILFESIEACAWAFALTFMMYPVAAYMLKERCLPNDLKSLAATASAGIKLLVGTLLMPALIVSADYGHRLDAPILVMLACAAWALPAWVVTAIATHHPIASEPMFRTIVHRLPRFTN